MPQTTSLPKNAGFTLIELVVVIVILGILAATALSKFVDLGKDARIAKVKTMEGTVRTAAEMWHAAIIASDPACMGKNQNLTRNGVTVFTYNCYPQAGLADVANYPQIESLVDYSGYTIVQLDHWNTMFQVDGAPDPSNCGLKYTEARTQSGTPTYTMLVSGCGD